MDKDTRGYRRCIAAGCFRVAQRDSNLCRNHYERAIYDAIDYARDLDPATDLPAYDDRDGGHNDQ